MNINKETKLVFGKGWKAQVLGKELEYPIHLLAVLGVARDIETGRIGTECYDVLEVESITNLIEKLSAISSALTSPVDNLTFLVSEVSI